MAQNKFTVIVDTREKSGWSFSEDDYCDGSISSKLDTGDYSIREFENLVTIERKRSVGELAGNITEKRFEREMERMSSFRHKFIIIESTLENVHLFPINSGIPQNKWSRIKISPQFILKKINEYQMKYGINIVFAGGYGKEYCYNIFKWIVNESS